MHRFGAGSPGRRDWAGVIRSHGRGYTSGRRFGHLPRTVMAHENSVVRPSLSAKNHSLTTQTFVDNILLCRRANNVLTPCRCRPQPSRPWLISRGVHHSITFGYIVDPIAYFAIAQHLFLLRVVQLIKWYDVQHRLRGIVKTQLEAWRGFHKHIPPVSDLMVPYVMVKTDERPQENGCDG